MSKGVFHPARIAILVGCAIGFYGVLSDTAWLVYLGLAIFLCSCAILIKTR
jgi:hypothetical protein